MNTVFLLTLLRPYLKAVSITTQQTTPSNWFHSKEYVSNTTSSLGGVKRLTNEWSRAPPRVAKEGGKRNQHHSPIHYSDYRQNTSNLTEGIKSPHVLASPSHSRPATNGIEPSTGVARIWEAQGKSTVQLPDRATMMLEDVECMRWIFASGLHAMDFFRFFLSHSLLPQACSIPQSSRVRTTAWASLHDITIGTLRSHAVMCLDIAVAVSGLDRWETIWHSWEYRQTPQQGPWGCWFKVRSDSVA